MNLTNFSHAVGQNAYHLVWKPKYAHAVFKSFAFRKACEGAIKLVAFQYHFKIYELKVMPDHIHLFVECPPTMSVSKALQLFKGISSRILRRNFSYLRDYKSLWSPGKFFRSVGNVTMDTIQHYIQQSYGSWKFAEQKKLSSFAL